jgi:hypothetical protein
MTARGQGGPPDAPGQVGVGERFDRRTALKGALRAGAATAFAAALPGALAACGERTPGPAARADWPMCYLDQLAYNGGDYGGSPPLGDLARLVRARAHSAGASIGMSPWSADERADLSGLLMPAKAGDDPVTGKPYAPAEALVVAGLADPRMVEGAAAGVIAAGLKVVSYLVALEHQTAAITIDPARAGSLLALHAAGWAHDRLSGRGRVLLVPRAHSAASVVLCWDDRAAVSIARELRVLHPGARGRLYVGAFGLPALASRDTIDELRRDDVLRAVVAARPRDLAEALVELPLSLLRGATARDVRIPMRPLTPARARSPRTRATTAAIRRRSSGGSMVALA